MTDKEKISEFLERVSESKDVLKDLSSAEDLSIAVMNIISIEEHLYFTAMKTGKEKYLALLNSAREIRKELMKKLVTNPQGEEWCISKHLLASSMRLIETGNKYLKDNKRKDAQRLFENAFELYSMFWVLNLGKGKSGKDIKIADLEKFGSEKYGEDKKFSLKSKISEIVKKIIDCCKE